MLSELDSSYFSPPAVRCKPTANVVADGPVERSGMILCNDRHDGYSA
jgi:hypothetical protein